MEAKALEKKDYKKWVKAFQAYLSSNHPDCCFFVYGSYARNEHDPKLDSDLDGGIILPYGVITDKKEVKDISNAIGTISANWPIPLQLNLMDRKSNRDGRFLSYTPDYTDYFKQGKALVLSGPDYVSEMNGLDYKLGVLNAASFNLRNVRNSLLMSRANQRMGLNGMVIENVQKAVDKTIKMPKKLVYLIDGGEIIENNKDAMKRLKTLFPKRSFAGLEYLHNIREKVKSMDPNSREIFELYDVSVSVMESIIGAYINTFPVIGNNEVKT